MRVFKFGGASVKNAATVENVSDVISLFSNDRLIVVVSAMGKTTNALEEVVKAWKEKNSPLFDQALEAIYQKHVKIISQLFDEVDRIPVLADLNVILEGVREKFLDTFSDNYDFEYDQIVSLGEVISTKIVADYLRKKGKNVVWADARKLVRTDRTFRNGNVDWQASERLIQGYLKNHDEQIIVTQGFIGHTPENLTTTLGREGSDYTAAIFAYCANAQDVTIWKDVPGMLNADPKYFENTVKLNQISFREAIELAYYGASVIHPKTIKPLQNKQIPLYVKSFIHPQEAGTVIQEDAVNDANVPSYIFKKNQLLISVMPTDFSFIAESSLERIFHCLSEENVTINIMQNSAVSFSFLADEEKVRLDELVARLSKDFKVHYNKNVELVTIRHYNDEIIRNIVKDRKELMTQKDRQTIRLVLD